MTRDDASVNTRIILIIATPATKTQFEQILFLYWGIKIFSHRMERTIWNKYDSKTPVVHIPVIIVFGVKIYFIAEEILVITLLLLHHHLSGLSSQSQWWRPPIVFDIILIILVLHISFIRIPRCMKLWLWISSRMINVSRQSENL